MIPMALYRQQSINQPAPTETNPAQNPRPRRGFIGPTESAVRLTPREKEVMIWTAEGKTAYEVGIILGISIGTVNFHVNNSVAKFGVRSKIQAAVHAALLGLLS
jgi:DNA-binding CsgD family transcriptional regulator